MVGSDIPLPRRIHGLENMQETTRRSVGRHTAEIPVTPPRTSGRRAAQPSEESLAREREAAIQREAVAASGAAVAASGAAVAASGAAVAASGAAFAVQTPDSEAAPVLVGFAAPAEGPSEPVILAEAASTLKKPTIHSMAPHDETAPTSPAQKKAAAKAASAKRAVLKPAAAVTAPKPAMSRTKRWTAATASTASLGLAMSLMFAFPANADPSTLSPSTLKTIVDRNGHTAAQILSVSNNVTMPVVQRDNEIASALAAIVVQAGGVATESSATAISNALQYGGPRQSIVETALSYLGDPYVLDGSTHAGIDCSGLVMVSYAQVGINLKHLVSAQDDVATPITEAEALPGDVVVFNSDEHIGIYLGGGYLIQAPEPGTPVNIVPVWTVPHHFARILPAGE